MLLLSSFARQKDHGDLLVLLGKNCVESARGARKYGGGAAHGDTEEGGIPTAKSAKSKKNLKLDCRNLLDSAWRGRLCAPPAHFIGGYKGAVSERQPPVYFRLGGGTLKGISRPGHIVWSRVFVMDGRLHCDPGVATVVILPLDETERR
jgi:hypothetical protein